MGDRPQTSRPHRDQSTVPGSAVLTPPTGLPAVEPSIPAPRRPVDVRPPAAPATIVEPCACGHPRAAHEHYRRGDDCGACGATSCAAFRRLGGSVRRALRRWGLVE